jgi:hypothetical protein
MLGNEAAPDFLLEAKNILVHPDMLSRAEGTRCAQGKRHGNRNAAQTRNIKWACQACRGLV